MTHGDSLLKVILTIKQISTHGSSLNEIILKCTMPWMIIIIIIIVLLYYLFKCI